MVASMITATRSMTFGLGSEAVFAETGLKGRGCAVTGRKSADDPILLPFDRGRMPLVERCAPQVHLHFFRGPNLIRSRLQRNASENSQDWLKTSACER